MACFVGRKSTIRNRELVSMTVRMYRLPWRDAVVMGPQMSLLMPSPAAYQCFVHFCGAGLSLAAAQLGQVSFGGVFVRNGGRWRKRFCFAICWSVLGRISLNIIC